MLLVPQILLLILAAIFGFRWQLLYLDIPGDALYRALVLEIVRLSLVLLPFVIYFFRRPTALTSLYVLVVAMWASTIYLVYFSIFLPAGFNFAAIDLFGADFVRPINLAKSVMFFVWFCLSLVSIASLLRLRS